MAKCYLGEVKLKRIGLRLSPIAVRDLQSGTLQGLLLIIADQLFVFGISLWILTPVPFWQMVADSRSLSSLSAGWLVVS